MEYVQANSLEAVHLWAAMEAQAGAASAGTVRQLVHISAVFDRFQLVFIEQLNPKSLKTLNPKTLKATLITRTPQRDLQAASFGAPADFRTGRVRAAVWV